MITASLSLDTYTSDLVVFEYFRSTDTDTHPGEHVPFEQADEHLLASGEWGYSE